MKIKRFCLQPGSISNMFSGFLTGVVFVCSQGQTRKSTADAEKNRWNVHDVKDYSSYSTNLCVFIHTFLTYSNLWNAPHQLHNTYLIPFALEMVRKPTSQPTRGVIFKEIHVVCFGWSNLDSPKSPVIELTFGMITHLKFKSSPLKYTIPKGKVFCQPILFQGLCDYVKFWRCSLTFCW